MTDTDLTDPHGEAEALRRENARLREDLDRWRYDCLDANNSEAQLRRRAKAAEADLAALRAQPDWKAMAERLGAALEKIKAMDRRTNCRNGDVSKPVHVDGPIGKIAAAALSDLAKMKGE